MGEFWRCCCCLGRFIVAGARSSGGERCKKETACRPGAKWETAAKNEPLVHNSSRLSSLTLFLRSRARRRRLPTQSVLDLRARCRVSLSTLSLSLSAATDCHNLLRRLSCRFGENDNFICDRPFSIICRAAIISFIGRLLTNLWDWMAIHYLAFPRGRCPFKIDLQLVAKQVTLNDGNR